MRNDITTTDPGQTMSTTEIAELTDKEHRNVLRDARAMLIELHGEGGLLRFEQTQRNPQNGQSYPVLLLPKRESLILVSGYSVEMRAKIVDRWIELEQREAAGAGSTPALARINKAREARLSFNSFLRICKMMGITGNHAIVSANSATKEVAGVDMLGALNLPRLTTDTDGAQINATDIGRQIGITAREVNHRLVQEGYATTFRDSKNRLVYEPTEKGKAVGGRLTMTGKKHSNGTPVTQLVWSTATVRALQREPVSA